VKRARAARRGIYLISTLLLLTFLVIVGGAVMVSFQQGIASSSSFNNRQMALQAAMAGLQYFQATLESSMSSFSPSDSPATRTLGTSDSSVQILQKQFNVCGLVSNSSADGGGQGRYLLLFRIAFNSSYSAWSASPSDWSFVTLNGTAVNLPPIQYVSMNNLPRNASTVSNSYDENGSAFHRLPGGTVDLIVEGMAISPSGTVLGRRYVESLMKISQVGGLSAAASSAGDMGLTIGKSGGSVLVSAVDANGTLAANASLASLSNISIYGQDDPGGQTHMPGYSAPSKASLTSTSSKSLSYVYNGSSTDYTSADAQQRTVNPPAISTSQLPAVRSGNLTVNAGLWVVWNGSLYHYATDYQATDGSGNPIPLTQQPWAQSDPNSPPTYNGVAPDSGSFPAIDTQGSLLLDKTTNQITISDKDVEVQPVARAGGGAQVNSFALMVAPSTYGGGTISVPAGTGYDSAAVGSAQLSFQPPAGTAQPPQLRVPGTMTVLGNVVGEGSLVTTGVDSGNNSIAADINVIGKSSLDTRSDSGVAIYAAGNMNLLQLSQAQAPAAVPAVADAFSSQGITPGSGSGASSATPYVFTDVASAVYSALTQAMQAYLNAHPSNVYSPGTSGNGVFSSTSGPVIEYTPASNPANTAGDEIKDFRVNVTLNGHTYSDDLKKVLPQLVGSSLSEFDKNQIGSMLVTPSTGTPGSTLVNGVIPLLDSNSAWNGTTSLGGHNSRVVDTVAFNAYQSFGSPSATATPTPTPTPSGSPSASPSTSSSGAPQSLDQTFSGLIYAQKNINMRNDLGQITIDGALAAYGGDPGSESPGAGGTGNVAISADSIRIQYDPATLGPYASFFGGQVQLQRNFLTNF
jgi:hypothetical protein